MDRPARDLPLAEKTKECQDKCGKTYGYRRVCIWLEREEVHHNPKNSFRSDEEIQSIVSYPKKKISQLWRTSS